MTLYLDAKVHITAEMAYIAIPRLDYSFVLGDNMIVGGHINEGIADQTNKEVITRMSTIKDSLLPKEVT